MSDNVLYLWAAGVLVALFGIWYCLYTRLPKGNGSEPGQKRLSKKEQAELRRKQEIKEAAAEMLAERGQIEVEQDEIPRVSQKPNVSATPTSESTAERIRAKYTKKVV